KQDAYISLFSSRRRHTRSTRDWSSDVCSSDLASGPSRADTRDLSREPADGPRARRAGLSGTREGDRLGSADVDGGRTPVVPGARSEERRVGKEWRARGWAGGGISKDRLMEASW